MARRPKIAGASPAQPRPNRKSRSAASRDAHEELEQIDAEANRALLNDDRPERETRGEKKRRAERLERLGVELVKLPDAKLARLDLPDDLRAAVMEAKRIKHTHGGYRRQIQFIGRIMRGIDATPIAAGLEALKQEDAPSAASFRAAAHWRDRLIAEGDSALEMLLEKHPAADRTMLRQLIRQARSERAASRPPRAARELFRALHALFQKRGVKAP